MSAVNNENFRDQLACADIIVGNKEDRATAESHAAFDTWWQFWW
jgi:G3E family GTPase